MSLVKQISIGIFNFLVSIGETRFKHRVNRLK